MRDIRCLHQIAKSLDYHRVKMTFSIWEINDIGNEKAKK